MKLTIPLISLAPLVTAAINFTNFHPPFPGDLRSPCPALNALANHYIIPHSGRNLTVPMLVKAFRESMNIDEDFTSFVATAALSLAPDSGASGQFSLEDISAHGRNDSMEHDGSLSREDFAKGGDATSFNKKVFKEFLGYFGGKKDIDIEDAARARWGRIQTSRRTNPSFSYTFGDRLNSYIQSAIYMQSLKDVKTQRVPVKWIKVWYEEERLPYKEGWRPNTEGVSVLSLLVNVLSLAMFTPEKAGDLTGSKLSLRASHGALI